MERLAVGETSPYNPNEYAIHLARYLPLRDVLSGRRVLDASCGEGYGTHIMARAWDAKSVVGVDNSGAAIGRARSRFAAPNLSFVESSLEDFIEDALGCRRERQDFDAIVSVETLEHLEDPAKVLAGFKALLAPGGIIYVTIPNDPFYFGEGTRSLNKFHKHVFDFAAAKALTEPLLGPGTWSLGSVAAGFCSYPLSGIECAEDFSAPPGAGQPASSANIPAHAQNPLRPEEALYFAGFWDFGAERSLPAASALYPAPADFRPPRLQQRPPMGRKRHRAGGTPRLRLAMVADLKGWAFDNIAKNISACLEERVSIEILYLREEKIHDLFARLFLRSAYDHVHFLWREPLLQFFFNESFAAGLVTRLARRIEQPRAEVIARLARGFRRTCVTFGVYDHLNLEDDDLAARRAAVALADGYGVSSRRLGQIWSKGFGTAPLAQLSDGVDRTLFKPSHPLRSARPSGSLVVGWVGNSVWNHKAGNDPKGLETILKPALAMLRDSGLAVRGHFADRRERWRPRADMPAYYGEIDLLVCCSAIEGTPNPVLEAMACGLPVVSTDVGIVPELLGPKQQAFIVERNVESLADAIRKIVQDPALSRALAEENLERIGTWEWADQAPKWLHLLREAERQRRCGRGEARAAYLKLFLEKLEYAPPRARSIRRRLTADYWKKKAHKLLQNGRI